MKGTQRRLICPQCGKGFFAWRPEDLPGARVKCYFCGHQFEDEAARRKAPEPAAAPAAPSPAVAPAATATPTATPDATATPAATAGSPPPSEADKPAS